MKPHAPKMPQTSEQASDDFTGEHLGLQWQFMGNWREDFFALEHGQLKLYACKLPSGGETLWDCPQTLTQKIVCPAFTVDTGVDVAKLHEGAQAGLALIGGQYAGVALRVTADGVRVDYIHSAGVNKAETVRESVYLAKNTHHVSLRMTLTPTGYDQAETVFSWSTDGQDYETIGQPFSPERGTWVGARPSLFAMPLHNGDDAGYAVFDAFRVTPAKSYPFDC
jgi:beta-xylosidase